MVACVFEVNGIANYITGIQKDDLLSTSAGTFFAQNDGLESELKVFNMSEMTSAYCEVNMDAEFITGDLLVYLQDGGDFSDIALSINGVCSCGMGRVMIEAWVCIPGGDDTSWIETERVAVLLSMSQASIVSIKSLRSLGTNRHADITISSHVPSNPRLPTIVICTSNDSPGAILFEIDLKRDEVAISTMQDELLLSQMFMGDLSTSSSPRLSVVNQYKVIMVDVISSFDEDGEIEQSKIALSFVPIQMNTMVYCVKSLSVKYSNMNFERFLPFLVSYIPIGVPKIRRLWMTASCIYCWYFKAYILSEPVIKVDKMVCKDP